MGFLPSSRLKEKAFILLYVTEMKPTKLNVSINIKAIEDVLC